MRTSVGALFFVAGLSLAGACATEDAAPTSRFVPDRRDGGAAADGAVDGGGDVEEGVVVGHERELRGAWISTVFNGTWPSAQGLSPDAARKELVALLDSFVVARMNAVFFQVRPEADALYPSALEPWSRFLTGKQGQDPGWDPLAFVLEEGHRRGLEIHAWLNPYRGLASANVTVAPTHITKTMASAARSYGNLTWMDPGVPEVRARVLDVVRDLLVRYDVDGIHFDDYFYPYPLKGQTFDDAAPYAVYTSGGGALAKDDWRRANVDTLVREVSEVVATTRSSARFGVSPFGIYRPGTPPGIEGLDAYGVLYADAVRWIDEGWVDYLAPQLYWPTTQTPQAFGTLLSWWTSLSKQGRFVFAGLDATKAGTDAFTLAEYSAQLKLIAGERENGARGAIWFSGKAFVEDQAGLRTEVATKHWTTPAASPPLALALAETSAPPPRVVLTASVVAVPIDASTRGVVVYREREEAYVIDRIVGVATSSGESIAVTLSAGTWAVSVLNRRGVESRGAVVTIP